MKEESRRKKTLACSPSSHIPARRLEKKGGDLERLLFLKVSSLPPIPPLPSPLSLSLHPSILPSLPNRAVRCHPPLQNGPRSVNINPPPPPSAVGAQLSDSERREARSGGTRRPLLETLELREKLRVTFDTCVPTHTAGGKEGAGENDKVGRLQFQEVLGVLLNVLSEFIIKHLKINSFLKIFVWK